MFGFLLHFRLGLVELLRRLLHCTVEPGAFDLVARLWFILLRFVGGDGGELGRSILVLHLSSEFLLLWTQRLHRTVDGWLRSRFADGGGGTNRLRICCRWNELATLIRSFQHQMVVLHEIDDDFRASHHQIGERLPGVFTVIKTGPFDM